MSALQARSGGTVAPTEGATADDQLRIGFLAQENITVPSPIPGSSVSRVVYELASALGPRYDVTICSLPHPTIPEGTHEGIRYLRVPDGLDRRRHRVYSELIRVQRRLDLPYRGLQGTSSYSRGYAVEGLHRLLEYDPQVVHLQNVSQFLPLARSIVPNAGLVLHMHCPWLVELPRPVVRRRLQHASLVLGVSEFIIDPVRNAFPEIAHRCHCLHNGVNLTSFYPRSALPEDIRSSADSLRTAWGAIDGPVILYVGQMAPIKGTHVLVDAFARLLEREPNATLVLVGSYGRLFHVVSPKGRRARQDNRLTQKRYRSEIERRARPLGPRVVFTGGIPHEHLAAYYAAADVVTMPSTGPEAFPLPVLEAFASEVPVVASEIGGLPEIVDDGVNGRLVPAGDAEALADALSGLCEDEALARRLGVAGRQLVAEHFTWNVQARRLAALYDGALSGDSGPVPE